MLQELRSPSARPLSRSWQPTARLRYTPVTNLQPWTRTRTLSMPCPRTTRIPRSSLIPLTSQRRRKRSCSSTRSCTPLAASTSGSARPACSGHRRSTIPPQPTSSDASRRTPWPPSSRSSTRPPAMGKLTKKQAYPNAAPKSQKYGSIIVISSVASTYGGCWGPSYTMATHAALGVVRAGVAVLKGTGVRINCISPGQVDVGVDLHGVSSRCQRHVFLAELLRCYADGHERARGAVPTSIFTNTRGQDHTSVVSA